MNSQLLRRIQNAERAEDPAADRPLKVRFVPPGGEPEPMDECFEYIDVVFVGAPAQEAS